MLQTTIAPTTKECHSYASASITSGASFWIIAIVNIMKTKTKIVEFVVQDCPIMGKVIHRHYVDEYLYEQTKNTQPKKRV